MNKNREEKDLNPSRNYLWFTLFGVLTVSILAPLVVELVNS